MPGYTYAPPPDAPPKGHWKSYYGGYERTPFARFACGATLSLITQDQSPAAKRARIRARKREKLRCDLTAAEIDEALARLDAEEAQMTKAFHNG